MGSPHLGLFVCGTDTGVGKTLVACSVIKLLRSRKIDAVGFKPAASGSADGRWEDADALHAASDRCEPAELICPIRFHAPLAPTMAAPRENRVAGMQPARRAFEELRSRHGVVVAEGVGGIMVPLDERTRVIDFMRETAYPALLVCRAALGTINHTLLTLNELNRAGIAVSGIVMNCTQPIDPALARETKEEIERLSGKRIGAILPHLQSANFSDAAEPLGLQLDAASLLTTCR